MASNFLGSSIEPIQEEELVKALKDIAKERHYMLTEPFLQKILQLYQLQKISHGIMLVGPSGVGKSAAWKILSEAMNRVSKVPCKTYYISPLPIHKDDNNTMLKTDDVFATVLRTINQNQNQSGKSDKIYWIFFDGDVNPLLAENLNNLLDDQKSLKLPNGERLSIPPNVKIMFEVETLKYTSLDTVSRCGMVRFSENLVSQEMINHHFLNRLTQQDFFHVETDPKKLKEKQETQEDFTRKECVQAISQYFEGNNSFVQKCVEIASKHTCVMEFSVLRVLEAIFAQIRKGISNVIDYNESNSDLPLDIEVLRKYMQNWTLFSICWGISDFMTLKQRQIYSDEISKISPITTPPKINGWESIIDYEVSLEKGGEFLPCKKKESKCVNDQFNDWSDKNFIQVAKELNKAKIIDQTLESSIQHMNKSVEELNNQLNKSDYITTKDFSEFFIHFEQLFISKSEQLANQQKHLSISLDKFKETKKQLIVMQATLRDRKNQLYNKEREATEKLKEIDQEKIITGQSRDESIVLSKLEDIKKIEIQERKEKVNYELEQVLPMLESAKQAVSNINQDNLKFIQAQGKPPALVQFTVAAVIAIIKNTDKEMSWAELLQEIKDKQFIPTIMNYNTDNLKAKVRQHVEKTYINNKDWVIADINRASKAAGPLAEWCDSQIKLGRILYQVGPLRAQVESLEEEEKALFLKKVDLDIEVNKLEAKMDALSKNYEILTSEKERFKNDMESIKQIQERSEKLIKNVQPERHRQDGSCQNSKSQQSSQE